MCLERKLRENKRKTVRNSKYFFQEHILQIVIQYSRIKPCSNCLTQYLMIPQL